MTKSSPEKTRASRQSRPARFEIFMAISIWIAAGSSIAVLAWILFDIGYQGITHLSLGFLTKEVENAGTEGGIGPVIVSTFLLLFVTLGAAVPLSLATAIELTDKIDNPHWLTRNLRRLLDVLAGVPSIVFGLFGNALFSNLLGFKYSILSGGLTLACMILPLLIRTFEQAIIAVPNEYRYAAAALGLGKATTLWRVVLPAAAPGLAAAVVLSTGRALAETAALIFTSGYVTRTPESLLDSGRSMSVHIYDLTMNVSNGSPHAYATACVLVVLLLAINATTAGLLHWAGLAHRPSSGVGW